MQSAEDHDYDKIAALEVKLDDAENIRKTLQKERDEALELIEDANTELYAREQDVEKKQKEITKLQGVIEELQTDLRDERRTTTEITDSLQKAWADLRKSKEEYAVVAQARDEAEARQRETQQQLEAVRDELGRMEAELGEHGALQEEATAAEELQFELQSDLKVLRELGNPEERKIIILTERNIVLQKENHNLIYDNKLLKRAVKAQRTEELTPELAHELALLDTVPSPTDSSLAEELDGYDYEHDDIDYDSESTVDTPVEVSSVATQTHALLATMTSRATQSDTPPLTAAVSKAGSSQTPGASASTQTDKLDETTVLCKGKNPDPAVRNHSFIIKAVIVACYLFTVMTLVDELRPANGDGDIHDYGYGYGYVGMYDRSGAYGNGRYLFNKIPIAMDLGGFEPLAGFSSRLIACLEEWAGFEPVLLY